MSVRRAQHEIDREELLHWMAYDRIAPFGPERDDFGTAQIACILAQVYGKKGRSYKPTDFMPFLKTKKKMTGAEMGQSLIMFAKMHNSRLKKG